MYKFSAPMPYTKEDIDKILEINNQVQKSKITSLYACVPRGCEVFTGFEQSRNFSFDNTSWDYWKSLITHTLNKGADFIYLLNSQRPLTSEQAEICFEKLERLLIELRKIGIKKLRVASAQLMTHLSRNHSDFDILASTSLEYKTIWEYQNFIHFHPEVKQIVPSHDINKNFKLLKHIRKRYPDMEIELMVNEGCLQGCPNRMLHETCNYSDNEIHNNNIILNSGIYCNSFCSPIVSKYPIQSLVIGTNIFPWDIEEYVKIGIKNFKFVGRDGYLQNFKYYINSFNSYLKGIDDIKNIENCSLADFTHHLQNNAILNQLTVKDYKKYLPNIKQFIKKGHLCASRCAVECRYCYKCAEKINNKLNNDTKKSNKTNNEICFIKK